jgi:hypothetical protein
LKINIARIFKVLISSKAVKEEITFFYIIAISFSGNKSHLLPPSDITNQYTLIRLSKVEDIRILTKLNIEIRTVREISNIKKLHNKL